MTRKAVTDYTRGTIQRGIAELVDRGLTRSEIFAELRPNVLAQIAPWIFKYNVLGGTRQPLPMAIQLQRLWDQIGRVMSQMHGVRNVRTPMPEIDPPTTEPTEPTEPTITPDPEPEITPEPDTEPETAPEPEIEPEPEPTTVAGLASIADPVMYFKAQLSKVIAYCQRQAELGEGEDFDHISNRPILDGLHAVREGVHPDVVLHNITMQYENDEKLAAGLTLVTQDQIEAESIRLGKVYDVPETGVHKMAGLAIAYVRANVPLYLIGPAGSGKSHLMRQVADFCCTEGLEYAECPMTAGATPSNLLGNVTMPSERFPDGFRERPFTRLYEQKKGGLFTFEEIDASDPNMILTMNNAIALAPGEPMFNQMSGDSHKRSKRMRLAATGNTLGLGGDRNYKGREGLDGSTLDRFRAGRLFVDMDYEMIWDIALRSEQPTL